MANLKGYIDAPLFYDGTELSATLLTILRNNSESIKNSVLLPQPAFNIGRTLSTQNGKWFWRGGFQYRTGLTTATLIIYSKEVSGSGEHDIVVTFDGAEVARYDARIGGTNVGGYHAVEVPINTRGYFDYQIITVECFAMPVAGGGSDDATKGMQYVWDAYVGPLSNINVGIWPGLPTFGTVDGTKLNQLSNAADYLANRLSTVPMPLSMGYVEWMGTNNPAYPNWRYFVARATNGNRRLRTNVWYQCRQTSASITLNVGGINTVSGPYSWGQNVLIQFDFDMIAAGLSWNVDYFSFLQETVHVKGPSDLDNNGGRTFSRISNGPIWMKANSYSVPTVRPENLIGESLTYSTVQTRLNNIASDLTTSYTTMNANPRVFDRATMFTSRYGINAEQNEFWSTTFIPSIYRQGDILWVKGQGLKIAYGSTTIKHAADEKPNGIREYTFQYEKEILDGDKVTQAYFYLDQFEALYPGMRYYIIGKDVSYAAEHLR